MPGAAQWRTRLALATAPSAHSKFINRWAPTDRCLWRCQRASSNTRCIYLPGGEQLGSLNVRRQAVQAELGWSLGPAERRGLACFAAASAPSAKWVTRRSLNPAAPPLPG